MTHFIKKDLTEVYSYLPGNSEEYQEFPDTVWIEDLKIVDGELVYKNDEDKVAEELQTKFDELEGTFNNQIDILVDTLKGYIAQKETLTDAQVERYEAKYQIALKAKEGDEDAIALLEIEAGGDATELIDLIIAMGDAWNLSLNTLLSLIDAFRVRIQTIIADGTSYEEVEIIVNKFLDLDLTELTVANVKALFEAE